MMSLEEKVRNGGPALYDTRLLAGSGVSPRVVTRVLPGGQAAAALRTSKDMT
jgi:hypothetical protein